MYSRAVEAREAARYLPFEVLLSNVRCGFFDQTCSLLGRGEFSGHDCCPLSENICRSAVGTFSPWRRAF